MAKTLGQIEDLDMTGDDKSLIHIDAANKREDLPDMGSHDVCPTCSGPLQTGFGLAGGGYGVYTYCETCSRITSKTEEKE